MRAGSDEIRDVIIIGGGPAGLTAAIYTGRALLEPLVIEGDMGPGGELPGGQLMLTTDVENFPGFPKGVLGPELIELFREQASRFGAEIVHGAASAVDFTASPFTVTSGGIDYRGRAVIIATGASPRMLGIPGEERLRSRGVSTCATCDGPLFRDKRLAVVGGGDSALEEALFLTRFARQVTVIHRRRELRASRIMQERALASQKIDFLWGHVLAEVLGENVVTGIRVADAKTGEESTLEIDGLFVAIGHKPNTEIFAGQIELDENGYVATKGRTGTAIDGVFAAGDAVDHVYRQAITAAALGCMAAIDAERWLDTRGNPRHP